MTALDLKKELKSLYTAPNEPQLVDVPPRQYLMIDGSGDPNTSDEYKAAVSALYTIAYGLRAAIRSASGTAYTVMPLEGLWWVSKRDEFSYADKSNWQWTLLISQPDAASAGMFENTRRIAQARKPGLPLAAVRLEMLHEGLSAQILHVGPFAEEPATIARLDDFIASQRCVHNGKHHETYLSDFQRAAPQKLKTIIRYPVAKS